ncbi:MAG: SpoIIE family protein phosphatase [Leptospirales bacterium]|nr:SpoIIE family protein phosphatase [Leptospirales bacterium]
MRYLQFFLLLACVLISLPRLALQANPIVAIPDSFTEIRIGAQDVLFLEDAENKLSIEQIKASQDFKATGSLDLLETGKTYWLRLEFSGSRPGEYILEAISDLVDRIQVYYPAGDQYLTKESGVAFPFAHREIANRYSAFRIPVTPNAPIYLKLHFNIKQHFSLKLWDREAFARKNRREHMVFGLYYGALIIMVLYNLFLAISLRSLNYLYYVLYILSFGFYQTTLNGISFEYFWPQLSGLDVKASFISAGLSIFFSGLFARQFLGITKRSPFFNRLLLALSGTAAVWILLSQFIPYQASNLIGRILGSIAVPTILAASIWAWRDGYRPARFFFLAWSLFLIGVLMFTLTGLGIIPWTPASRWSMQIGSAIEVLLLALALGDRINTLRDEKERAVARGRTMAKELQIAKRIQTSILPEKPATFPGLNIECRYLPAREVGGDFYDFCTTDEGLGLLVVDVCGHGVPAALIASMVKVSFASHMDLARRPEELILAMNDELAPRVANQFITAIYLYLDSARGRLTVASAGHPPILIWRRRDNRLIEVAAHGPVIGWPGERESFAVSEPIETGDRIIAYTDGIFEQRGTGKELFSFQRFHGAIKAGSGESAAALADRIIRDVKSWAGRDRLDDDVTLAVIDVVQLDKRMRLDQPKRPVI